MKTAKIHNAKDKLPDKEGKYHTILDGQLEILWFCNKFFYSFNEDTYFWSIYKINKDDVIPYKQLKKSIGVYSEECFRLVDTNELLWIELEQ